MKLSQCLGLLSLLFTVLVMGQPAQAQWFQERTTAASQIAERVPDTSWVVVSWHLGDAIDPIRRRETWNRIAYSLPEEFSQSFPTLENRLGASLSEIVDYQSGNGYFSVSPGETFDDVPHIVMGLELQNPVAFEKWFSGLLEREMDSKSYQQGKFRAWDLSSMVGPTLYVGEGWFFVSSTVEGFEAHEAALQGRGRLNRNSNFRKALASIPSEPSSLFFYVDIHSVYEMVSQGASASGVEIPEGLDVWEYGVAAADFSNRETRAMMALRPGVSPLANALAKPGQVNRDLYSLLPENMSSMAAMDIKWGTDVVEGFLKTVPFLESLSEEMVKEALVYGDPSKAFTGRLVYSTDLVETLGPALTDKMGAFPAARSAGQLTACKSNLKNIGTALEMYSTDWSGRYPEDMNTLVPNYLRTIPECPKAEKVTYLEGFQTGLEAKGNDAGYKDYYYVECHGNYHSETPENHPQYNAIVGLTTGQDELEMLEESSDKPEGPPEPSTIFVAEVADVEEAHNLLTALTKEPPVNKSDACQSNLKNIGTALEMYSTDWSGKYPTDTSKLVPNYLRTMPECPEVNKDTYSESYQTGLDAPGNTGEFEDFYAFHCHGKNHPELEANHPQYNGIRGLEVGPIQEVAEPEAPKRLAAPTTMQSYGDNEVVLVLHPQRKVVMLAVGDRAEELVKSRGVVTIPNELSRALDWGKEQTIYSTYSNLDGAYDFTMSYFKKNNKPQAAETLRLIKSWTGELKDAQILKATPEGLHFWGKGYGSSAGLVAPVAVGAAIMAPNFIRAQAQGEFTACKSNLRNIATGLEMWGVDHDGDYPESLDQLTPDYLREIPDCPSAEGNTYSQSYKVWTANAPGPEGRLYEVYCSGAHHNALDIPSDHPRYNSVEGLVER